MNVALTLTDEIIDLIAERVAAILADRQPVASEPRPESPYMTIPEAAAYLRCSRQRVDDLLSQRRLTRVKDGARTLIRREEIETWLVQHEVRR